MKSHYDYRVASTSPLQEFDTPDKVDGFKLFVRRLAWWMGMSTPGGIKGVVDALKEAPYVQKWLTQYVNPSSAHLYYGARWAEHQLPEIGSVFPRHRSAVRQWSRHEKTARWFAGLTGTTKPRPDWLGGVLCEGRAKGREILVDVDALSTFLDKHKAEFEALGPDQDSLGIFNGQQWEGEVLTLSSVKAMVIEAELF